MVYGVIIINSSVNIYIIVFIFFRNIYFFCLNQLNSMLDKILTYFLKKFKKIYNFLEFLIFTL